jgi:hypothetical protein
MGNLSTRAFEVTKTELSVSDLDIVHSSVDFHGIRAVWHPPQRASRHLRVLGEAVLVDELALDGANVLEHGDHSFARCRSVVMSNLVAVYVSVGFLVHESDFWDLVPETKWTCEKGHVKEGVGLFCSLDGTPFKEHHDRVASAKFKALKEHFRWDPEGPGLHSWLEGFERIYKNLHSSYPESGRIGLFQVNQHLPVEEPHNGRVAFAKIVAIIPTYGTLNLGATLSWSVSELEREFQILENARKVAGFANPVRVFISLRS